MGEAAALVDENEPLTNKYQGDKSQQASANNGLIHMFPILH